MTQIDDKASPLVRFSTSKGDIDVELHEDLAPNTVANFIELTEKKFYDGLKFHRVIDKFMIQGGCPQGTGTGGPGYKFADEIHKKNIIERGRLCMANAGPNTNGSQFFITHVRCDWLDKAHTMFGTVVSGLTVVDAIKQGDKITSVTVQRKRSHPYKVKTL